MRLVQFLQYSLLELLRNNDPDSPHYTVTFQNELVTAVMIWLENLRNLRGPASLGAHNGNTDEQVPAALEGNCSLLTAQW